MRSTMRSARCDTLITASRQPPAARGARRGAACLPPRPAPWEGRRSEDAASPHGPRRGSWPSFELVEEPGERGECGVALGHCARIAEEARRILEIFWLAVAIVDAREDTEDLEVALQSHPLERAPELREAGFHRQPGAPRFFPVPH